MKKVLYINQEITPYVPETPMSVIGKQMPQKMQELGNEIRTFMPRWGIINERRGQLHEVIRLSGMNIIVDDTDHPLIIKVASIPSSRLQVYFIDNDDYFLKRKMSVDEEGKEYEDNGERAVFFARGVLETVKKLRWVPDVIHCTGWMAAIVPFYLRTVYQDEPAYQNVKIVTTLYPETLQSEFAQGYKSVVDYKGHGDNLKNYSDKFKFADLMKLAIDYSDGIAMADKEAEKVYSKEIKAAKKPLFSYGTELNYEELLNFYDSL